MKRKASPSGLGSAVLAALLLISALAAILASASLLAPALSPADPAKPWAPDLRYIAADTRRRAVVSLQSVEGENWLLLPATADPEALALTFNGGPATLSGDLGSAEIASGQPVSLSSLARRDDSGAWALTLRRGETSLSFSVMVSENLRSLYLTSDKAEEGREWVERDKSNKAKGGIVLLGADGHVVYDGALKSIKGRGHSTWKNPKKPYQIKLAARTDLLETGDAAEVETTWVLLANYIDPTLLRDRLTFDLAAAFGLAYTPHAAPVDLYYDGEYRGSYLLCEKTEVSTGRVDIHDLEPDIRAYNPGVGPLEALEGATATSANCVPYRFLPGLTMPPEGSGGYLIEIDYGERAIAQAAWFQTTQEVYVAVKSPEYVPLAGMQYIRRLYQQLEDALFHGGVDPATGRHYTDLVDLDSLARYYLILELSADTDAFSSSTFFYTPAGEDKLYAGPVWDFDIGYGLYCVYNSYAAGENYLGRALLAIPSFRAELARLYREELYDLLGELIDRIPAYEAEVAASRRMNDLLWQDSLTESGLPQRDDLARYLTRRREWFLGEITAEGWEVETETVPDTWVLPQEEMTRAMLAGQLYAAAGSPAPTALLTFHDLFDGDSGQAAISWAVEQGIFSGYSSGSFGPNDPITRAQMVTLLARLAGGEPTEPAGVTDIETESWYSGALGWALEAGIAQLDGQGRFYPDRNITISQTQAMLAALGMG